MHEQCFFCPPLHFESHDRCHEQVRIFLRNCEIIEDAKENLNPNLFFQLANWVSALAAISETNESEEDFREYSNRLEEFNRTVRIRFGP